MSTAQLFDGKEYEYTSEWVWGINKNTNGGLIGGLVLRYSKSIGKDFYETYGIELSNVKHPSETRFSGQSGVNFTYGKSNYLYAIRFQYGRENLRFRKAKQQGIQVSLAAAAGPTIGLVTPYYLAVKDGGYEPYRPVPGGGNTPTYPSPQNYLGPGKLFQGLGESKAVPGFNIKGSTLFEFGTYINNVAGVEVGVMIEAFTKEIILVPTQPNKSIYSSVFFTLFWGVRK